MMTAFYANSPKRPVTQMNVLFVVYPNIVLLDLTGPLQVFTHARRSPTATNAYQTHVASSEGGVIDTNTILHIDSDPLGEWVKADQPIHTLVIIGGDGAIPAAKDEVLVGQVRALAARATRVCSVCSGALILAAAGLLDGRRAVTHWEDCEALAAQRPEVTVEVDPIYIKDGDVWTSAGITAGIDMSLAIIEEDLGKAAAIAMARSLVAPMVRSGGQSQFSADLDRQARDGEGRFADLHVWIASKLSRRISVEDMARECGMSPRNFSRRYAEVMGAPPARSVEAIRVDAARDLLAATDRPVKVIAAMCGFQDVERMRRSFLRTVNTSPADYRRQFRT